MILDCRFNCAVKSSGCGFFVVVRNFKVNHTRFVAVSVGAVKVVYVIAKDKESIFIGCVVVRNRHIQYGNTAFVPEICGSIFK